MEIKNNAKYELEHIILMLKVILTERCPKPSELNFSFVLQDNHLGSRFYESLHTVLKEFEKMDFF